jgi:hypothetical protein
MPRPIRCPGGFAGTLRLAGNTSEPQGVFGDVLLHITESDLANVDAIRLMYDLMHVGPGGSQPNGTGTMRGRLENNTLHVTGFRMFNRGVEVRGVATSAKYSASPTARCTPRWSVRRGR